MGRPESLITSRRRLYFSAVSGVFRELAQQKLPDLFDAPEKNPRFAERGGVAIFLKLTRPFV